MAAQQLPAPYVVSDFIRETLVIAGVLGLDESAEGAQLTLAMNLANDMIAQWQHERYMVFQLVDKFFTSTGAETYSVGAGGNYDINPRPDRLEFAFLRQLSNNGQPAPNAGTQPFDWPLDVIDAYENYAAIRLKKLGTFSSAVFYDPGWPMGTLKPWPIPQATLYEIHILYKAVLQRFGALQDKLNFPPEYAAALKWCLADDYRTAFQLPADPAISKKAARGKSVIRKANAQIRTLSMPSELIRNGNSAYNYRSDTP